MLDNQRIAVVLPAYNVGLTLKKTYDDIPKQIVDDIILTDDGSADQTLSLARSLGIHTLAHDANRGYGANQKTCYTRSPAGRGADIVVMLHPGLSVPAPPGHGSMAWLVASGEYDVVLGSRYLGPRGPRGGDVAVQVLLANRFLTSRREHPPLA